MPIITIQDEGTQALTPQKNIDTSNYPFTLNAVIGCLFGCSYCYLQGFPFNQHTDFGKEIKLKGWLPERLDTELERKSNLPQHLKRVQVNSATEGYLPQAIYAFETETGRNLMREILQVFQKHWENGNRWMVHLLTKSHLIRRDVDLITEMRNQVQIELTITTLDEDRVRLLEGTAPTVAKRLQLIEDFAAQGIFVRAMCMPFIGNESDAETVRSTILNHGARGFKHKGMNYWNPEELLRGNKVRSGGKADLIFENLLLKSGEPFTGKGFEDPTPQEMPLGSTSELVLKSMYHIDFGYQELNNVNWGYIH